MIPHRGEKNGKVMDLIVEHLQGQVDTFGFHLEGFGTFEGVLNRNMTL